MITIDDVEFIQIDDTGRYFDLAVGGIIIGCIWEHATFKGYYELEFGRSIYDVRHHYQSTTRDIVDAVSRVLYYAVNHGKLREAQCTT